MLTTEVTWCEEHTLHDGSHVWLRHIRPDDADQLREGLARLSPESRYRRFLGGVQQLSDDLLHYLTDVDNQNHVAIVAARMREDGTEEGLGVARFVRVLDEPTVAEPAITVLDGEQHKGLGRLLGATLARAARERGITLFRGEILANNDAIRQLLDDVGAVLHASEDARIVFDVALDRIAPPGDTSDSGPLSLLRAASTWLEELFGARPVSR